MTKNSTYRTREKGIFWKTRDTLRMRHDWHLFFPKKTESSSSKLDHKKLVFFSLSQGEQKGKFIWKSLSFLPSFSSELISFYFPLSSSQPRKKWWMGEREGTNLEWNRCPLFFSRDIFSRQGCQIVTTKNYLIKCNDPVINRKCLLSNSQKISHKFHL